MSAMVIYRRKSPGTKVRRGRICRTFNISARLHGARPAGLMRTQTSVGTGTGQEVACRRRRRRSRTLQPINDAADSIRRKLT